MAQLKDLIVNGVGRFIGKVYASEFVGKLTGNADSANTATKAKQDESGNNIKSSYASSISISDHTITLKNKNGASLGTVTVPDTNTWRPLGTTADTACAGNDARLSNSRPASDVYAWAKASSKPSYSWSEITSKPSTFTPASHTHSYLPLSGGTLNGQIHFNNNSLPAFDGSIPYLVGIESFADGGTLKWQSASSVSVGYATSAGNSDTVDGFHASQSAGSKSTCVVTDSNGYTNLNYINSNTGNNENPSISQVIVTNGSDNYYRKASLSHLKSSLGSMPASDVYAWAKASSKPSYSWSEITSKPSTFTPASHTHNYAGSSSAGGSATSAVKLDSSAGSATQPVYFSSGKPVACTYTLGKSVPSNAKFTDTTYPAATQSAQGLMSAADKKKLDGIASGANAYSLPTASTSTLGGIKVGSNLSISNGVLSATDSWRPVVNNLTSTSTTQSLSAAQGKALNDQITTLNSSLSKGFYSTYESITLFTCSKNGTLLAPISSDFIPANNSSYKGSQLCARVIDSYGISYFYMDATDFFAQQIVRDTSKYGWQLCMGVGSQMRYISLYYNGNDNSPVILCYASYADTKVDLYMMNWRKW